MVNKPFWHISDFVLASYTFGCVEISDFVPNIRHLREVLIFFFQSKKTAPVIGSIASKTVISMLTTVRVKEGQKHSKTEVIYYELLKPNETITGEWYRTQLMRLSWALRRKGYLP